MDIKSKLYNYMSELANYRRPKDVAMKAHIENRLRKSIDSYSEDLGNSCNYIETKSPMSTMRVTSERR